MRYLSIVLLLLTPLLANALELKPERVAENVYYFKGSLDGRTYENQAFNNNTGFVVTDAGVVLIDSGPSYRVAALIESAVATVTDQPIRYVISSGSQDHRWLGNGYFQERGAELIALKRTAETQRQFAERHMQRLAGILKDRFEGTEPVIAAAPIDADRHRLTIGGTVIELIYGGDAHFPGDVLVWLPAQRTVFTSDVVYVERMLGVHPWSDPLGWQQAFRALEALEPEVVVPGHGAACDLAKARAETGDYIDTLVREVRAGIEEWESLDETVERLADLAPFRHLKHYDEWHRMNVNRVYLNLEGR